MHREDPWPGSLRNEKKRLRNEYAGAGLGPMANRLRPGRSHFRETVVSVPEKSRAITTFPRTRGCAGEHQEPVILRCGLPFFSNGPGSSSRDVRHHWTMARIAQQTDAPHRPFFRFCSFRRSSTEFGWGAAVSRPGPAPFLLWLCGFSAGSQARLIGRRVMGPTVGYPPRR